MASRELLQGLIEAGLAGSAAIVLVLALRRPLRRAFGAQTAYALWLLVPLAMLASLLPAATVVATTPVVQALALPANFVLPAAPAQAGFDWPLALLAAWLSGVLLSGLALWRTQAAFRRRLGHLLPHGAALRAQQASAGLPATLGLWRPRIVLPVDFETRFDPAQRTLVLAHEQRHIACRDHWVNAAAALLRCLCWCNPLIHLAAARMRHDQELACDAAVLAAHPQQRRRYGDALLNAQLALQTVPLGCHFGFGHPLKERITMLRNVEISRVRRLSGVMLVALLGSGVALAAWATQPQTAGQQPAHADAAVRMASPPAYPKAEAEAKITGTVVMVVSIDPAGNVTAVAVEHSSGNANLDQAALAAAVKWKYQPAVERGKPVASKVRVPVEFAMDAPAVEGATDAQGGSDYYVRPGAKG